MTEWRMIGLPPSHWRAIEEYAALHGGDTDAAAAALVARGALAPATDRAAALGDPLVAACLANYWAAAESLAIALDKGAK